MWSKGQIDSGITDHHTSPQRGNSKCQMSQKYFVGDGSPVPCFGTTERIERVRGVTIRIALSTHLPPAMLAREAKRLPYGFYRHNGAILIILVGDGSPVPCFGTT